MIQIPVLTACKIVGIVACNPLLALLLDILRCEFSGTAVRVKIYLALSIVAYGSAIGVLSQIPSGGKSNNGSDSGSSSSLSGL